MNHGERVLSIRIRRKVIEAMLVSERLTDKESRDRKKLAAETALVLEEWAERWEK